MSQVNRRQFLLSSGTALASKNLGIQFLAEGFEQLVREPSTPSVPRVQHGLYNTDLRTIIGLGDEPASIVDKYGQLLRSRQAATRVAFGMGRQPAEKAEWSQSLANGYIPIVETRLQNGEASLTWNTFSSDLNGVKADYIEIMAASVPYQVTLLFPFSTSIRTVGRTVVDEGKVLAVFPDPSRSAISLAKYNLLTPEGAFEDTEKPTLSISGVDSAFTGSRGAFLNRWIEYRFPVKPSETYHVFLGVVPQRARPGETILKLSVNEQNQWVDYGLFPSGEPLLRQFKVIPAGKELRVKSACDSSATYVYRDCHLSGIWIFETPVNADQVLKGELSRAALFYVQCGRERLEQIVNSVTLDYEPVTGENRRCIYLPYDLRAEDVGKLLASASPETAWEAEKARWESLLQRGAELITGVPQLDNLYKTSLINLLLLRTRFPGQGERGQDIFVVKPGPNVYDTFWTRDGSYISTAFDVAGLPDEAEKSLRLFWHRGLNGTLATWGQQTTGGWAQPITELDAQGQALWTLVNHYEFTRDMEWLKAVYDSIVKGALWIKHATQQTKFLNENGERPIYYGLLPVGEGEAIAGNTYNYYHCFWSILGLRKALLAAQAMNRTDDLEWIQQIYDDFSSCLLTSLKLAYERTANSKFIPATPFDPRRPIWGSIAALYPTRFLDPHDPMITGTLEILGAQAKEDIYATDPTDPNGLWTYFTVEAAMCHLLRDELPTFYRLYNGYVSHASPTNAWVEWINLPERTGSGDMPHGWAAAQYVTIHRNSLLYENERELEFCWGVQPEWLSDGAELSVRRAATRFGKVDFRLRRSGSQLLFEYTLASKGHEAPDRTRLHVPSLNSAITSVRINGRSCPVNPSESVIDLY